MNRDKLAFPFRRYQMQPVWRADRPQKGRYREFWQCDADVIGSGSLLNEAELIQIYDRVFQRLSLPIRILINNRKILAGMAEVAGIPDQLTDFTVALDKIDKVGIDQVEAELREKGIPESAIAKLRPIALLEGSNAEKLETLRSLLQDSAIGLKGIAEMQELLNYFDSGLHLKQAEIAIDLSLARGLNYYTGTILEVKARNIAFGSIGGGGRYDDLTGIFGLPGVPGVGISFGADRIYDVLNDLNLFPNEALNTSEVLIANFSAEELNPCLTLVQHLREEGIPAEVYPEAGKLKKQFEYAEKKGIPFLMIYGATEEATSVVNVKELSSGRQVTVPRNEIATFRSFFNL
jgi:histidyl-tRNA synthetase